MKFYESCSQNDQVQLLKIDVKAYVRRHLYVFYEAIEQSMFKNVASENGPLVLIPQSYSQISVVL